MSAVIPLASHERAPLSNLLPTSESRAQRRSQKRFRLFLFLPAYPGASTPPLREGVASGRYPRYLPEEQRCGGSVYKYCSGSGWCKEKDSPQLQGRSQQWAKRYDAPEDW